MPPRSNGCRVCVSRRVKCDGTRPVCLRCQKAKLKCDGPPGPPVLFQDETEAITRKFGQQSFSRSRQRSTSPGPSTANDSPSAQLVHPDLFPTPSVPGPLEHPAEDVYCSFFLSTFFNLGSLNDLRQAQQTWLLTCYEDADTFPLANIAARALFTAYFARVSPESDLDTAAKHLYGEALTRLRADLSTQIKSQQLDVVSAITLLALFECLSLASIEGWSRHIHGMRAVFEMLGPSFFAEGPARAIFAFARPMLLQAARFQREPSFLGHDEWQFPPTNPDGVSRHIYFLHRLTHRFPGLLSEAQALLNVAEANRSSSAHTQRFLRTWHAWIGLHAELQSWRNAWTTDMPELLPRATRVDKSTPAGTSLPLDSVLSFGDVMLATPMNSFHACVVTVQAYLQRLHAAHAHLPPFSSKADADATLGFDGAASRATARAHATEIVRATPYILSYAGAHIGKLALVNHVRVAHQALPVGGALQEWIESVLRSLDVVDGIAIAEGVLRWVRGRARGESLGLGSRRGESVGREGGREWSFSHFGEEGWVEGKD